MRHLRSPAAVVLAIGGLYVGQSIIGGITFTALPSVLRDSGMALDRIGLTSLAVLPWVLKVLWAPAVERYRLPRTGPGRSRSIVLVGGLLAAAGLLVAGATGPTAFSPLMAIFVAIAFAASTVDIACDGFAVENLSGRHLGWGNAAQVGGAYLGAAIGSGLFLVGVAHWGWQQAMGLMAVLLVLLGLPFLLMPAPAPTALREHRPSLRDALRRPAMRRSLALAAVYVTTQKWSLGMVGPFLVDSGLDLASLGMLNGLGGMGVGFACALLGGALVRRWGAQAVAVLALALQATVTAGLALAAWRGHAPQALLLTLALANTSGLLALGFVALYARFMAVSDPRQAGIDFTLLQCMDALVSMIGGLGSGWVAQHGGYAACFGLAAALAILATPVVLALGGDGAGRSSFGGLARQPAS